MRIEPISARTGTRSAICQILQILHVTNASNFRKSALLLIYKGFSRRDAHRRTRWSSDVEITSRVLLWDESAEAGAGWGRDGDGDESKMGSKEDDIDLNCCWGTERILRMLPCGHSGFAIPIGISMNLGCGADKSEFWPYQRIKLALIQ